MARLLWLWLASIAARTASALEAEVAAEGSVFHALKFSQGAAVMHNTIVAGRSRAGASTSANIETQRRGLVTTDNGAQVEWENVAADTVRVRASYPDGSGPVGAAFTFPAADLFYGVWEYPFNGSITNNNLSSSTPSFDADIGMYGPQPGINWSNARAPFFFSRSGFGVYVDSPALGTFDFSSGKGQEVRFGFNATALTYNVIYNKNLTALLGRFGELSSRVAMPPESGYGPVFWSDDFEQDFHAGVTNAQENYYDVINHLYYEQIRATAMFADRPYGTGNMSFGNFDFDPVFYPTPEQFIANLSAWGFDFQVWAANRAFLDTELYNASEAGGWLFPGISAEFFPGPALNLSIPAAYSYFLEKMGYFAKVGVKGFKIDRGEEGEMPNYEQNIQQPLFIELCYKTMEAVWGAGNFYSFARSAFDRDRSRVAIWNGDTESTFEGLRFSVASGIRAGLLGFSQWGSDTGGYLRTGDQPSEELWARWMHFSAFVPMYEIMVGTNHTPWYDYSPRLVGVLKKTANLHAALLPYIRSYTYVASQTGIPVIRALFLEYPSDEAVYQTADEYAFGKEFLVAPIVSTGGSRSVYFPKSSGCTGGRFLEYFNKTAVFGPSETHNVTDLPLEYSPVYVREGAVVPTGDVYQGNAKWDKAWAPRLTLELYPSYAVPSSTFTYYRGNESASGVGPAMVTMTTDRKSKTITVAYDDLGVSAELAVYYKGSVNGSTLLQNVPLSNTGKAETVTLSGLTSLFD